VPQYKGGFHNALPRSPPQAPEILDTPPVAPGSRLTQVWQRPGVLVAYRDSSPVTSLEAQQIDLGTPSLPYQNQGEEFRPPYGETDGIRFSTASPPRSPAQGPRLSRSPVRASPSNTAPGLPLEALLGAVVGTLTILLILLAVLLVFLIRRQQHNNSSSPPASPALEEEEVHQHPPSASSRPLPRAPPIPLQQAPRRRPPPPPPPPLPERPLYCNNAFRPTPAQRNQGTGSAGKRMKDEAATDPCYYQLVEPTGGIDQGKPGSRLEGSNEPNGSLASMSRTGGSLASMSRTGGSVTSVARTRGSVAGIGGSTGRAGGSVASTGQTTIDWSCKSCDLTMETYSCFSMCNSEGTADQRDTDIRDLAEKDMIQEKEMEEKKDIFAKKEFLEKREMFDKKEPANNILPNIKKASNSIKTSKEDVESPMKHPQVPEEQSRSWDSKTYGEPMWKRRDLALELD